MQKLRSGEKSMQLNLKSKQSSFFNKAVLAVSLVLTIIPLLKHGDSFFGKTDVAGISLQYSQSQYVLGDAATEVVNDGVVYITAASHYIRGGNPAEINFEHPPLGKYLMGLSYKATGNTTVLNLAFLWLAYISFFWILRQLTNSPRFGLLMTILYGLIPLNGIIAAQDLLDTYFVGMLLLLIALSLGDLTKRRSALIGLVFGLVLSIKYPFPLMLGVGGYLMHVFLRQKKMWEGLAALGIGMLAYLSTYTAFFTSGNSVFDWAAFELYRFDWWTGERTMPKFLIFSLIFTGSFADWINKGEFISTPHWTLLWPVTFMLYVISVIKSAFLPHYRGILFLSLLFLAAYAVGGGVADRYVFQLIPLWLAVTSAWFSKNDLADKEGLAELLITE